MTDSGSVKPAPPQPGTNFTAPPAPNARLVTVPPNLQTVTEPVEIEGEVIEKKPDGALRIRTVAGEIDVQPNGKSLARLQPGETVEIEIQPGRPPQTARITPVQPEAPATTTTTGQPPTPAPPRTGETPIDIDIPPADTPTIRPVEIKTGTPILPDQPVRLEPLPAEAAQAFIVKTLQITSTDLPDNIVNQQNITAEPTQEKVNQNLNINAQQTENKIIFLPEAELKGELAKFLAANPQASTTTPLPSTPLPATSGITPLPPAQLPEIGAVEHVLSLAAQTPLENFTPETVPATIAGAPPAAQVTTPATTLTPLTAFEPPGTASPQKIFYAKIAALQPPDALSIPDQQTRILPSAVNPGTAPGIPGNPALILKNQPAASIPAIIVGHTAQNLPVAAILPSPGNPLTQTPEFFIIHTVAPTLTTGTEIALIPQPADQTPAQIPVLPLSFMPSTSWPLMDDIAQALVQAMPQAAQAFTNTIPSPANPGQMNPATLFFLAAVRGGDLSEWLGDRAASALKQAGRSDLLTRLIGEGSSLNRTEAQPLPGEWRMTNLPLYWDGGLHKIALYYKQDSEGKKQQGGGKQVRFIFDLALDKMGKVQLDGFFRAPKLDLIVRTQQPLSTSMQMQMRQAYIAALEPTEVKGELSFQDRPDQWVTIKPENRPVLGVSA